MKDWYSTIYKACIFSSVIAFILGFISDSKTSLGAYMAGYSVLILAVLMILTILFNNVLKVTANDSTFQILYSILMTAGPFILILGVISFVLYLLITYKDNIIDGKIAPGYNSFSNIIVMLLLVQLYMVYTNINTEKFESTGKMPKVTSGIIYLLGVTTSICSIILYTILKYFSTDGFRNIN
jgi:Na+/H+-translocating membrane pyrophosphatase